MLDVEDRVRDMLRRRAADVPAHVEAPSGMLRRAWRRVLMAFTGGVVAVALLAVGAAAGVRLLNQPTTIRSQGQAAAACRASDLQGSIHLRDSAGERLGSLVVTDVAEGACSLQGQPAVVIVDGDGVTLDVHEESAAPWWDVQSKGEPDGWPVVTLHHGDSARVRTDWASWCGSAKPAAWRIVLPGGGALEILDPQGHAPFCVGGSSRVQVGPFEPVT